MSAAEVLKAAKAAGIELRVEGCDIALEALARPADDLLERLAFHKPEIVTLLRSGQNGWSAEDWQAYFDERTGIAEFDGGLPRQIVDARAYACCVVEWLNRSFERSPPGRCLGCGGGTHDLDAPLPYEIEADGHAWPLSCCRSAWHAALKAEAVVALQAMGIVPPPKFPNDFGKTRSA